MLLPKEGRVPDALESSLEHSRVLTVALRKEQRLAKTDPACHSSCLSVEDFGILANRLVFQLCNFFPLSCVSKIDEAV